MPINNFRLLGTPFQHREFFPENGIFSRNKFPITGIRPYAIHNIPKQHYVPIMLILHPIYIFIPIAGHETQYLAHLLLHLKAIFVP